MWREGGGHGTVSPAVVDGRPVTAVRPSPSSVRSRATSSRDNVNAAMYRRAAGCGECSRTGGHVQRAAATLAAGSLVALAAAPLAGCGSHLTCLPPALHLTQTTVPAGGTTVLSSPVSPCKLPGVAGTAYVVTLLTLGRSAPVVLVTVRPSPDGSFSVPVQVPTAATPGQAVLSVTGSAVDATCKGTNRTCADYAVGFSIAPGPSATVAAPRPPRPIPPDAGAAVADRPPDRSRGMAARVAQRRSRARAPCPLEQDRRVLPRGWRNRPFRTSGEPHGPPS